MNPIPVGLRWTIGDVSAAGFEALSLSVWSAWNLFGESAAYAICANSIGASKARGFAGHLPEGVEWIDASTLVPRWLTGRVDAAMAEGVAWKFAPVRLFPDRYEISLDNDLILWRIPTVIRKWLASADGSACVMCEDTQRCFGQFASLCQAGPLNSGIRGLPPGFDLEQRLQAYLHESGIKLQSELDEQGLQATVLSKSPLFVVPNEDVTICSPFPGHQRHLGRCGAHFVGLNVKYAPWIVDGRRAHEVIQERWQHHRRRIRREILKCEWDEDCATIAAF